jgi:WD40 repeat protein
VGTDGGAVAGLRSLADVNAIALSPDERTAATAGRDGVRLWDLRSAQPPTLLPGHTGPVTSVAFSADGTAVASASQADGTVRLWKLPGVKPVAVPARPTGLTPLRRFSVGSAGFLLHMASADGPVLVRGARDLTLRDPADGRVLATLAAPGVNSYPNAAVSDDGRRIAVWSSSLLGSEGVSVWTSDGRRVGAGVGHPRGVRQMLFSPDGALIASVGGDKDGVGELRIWDADLKPVAGPLSGHHNGVHSVRWSADGKTLATVGLARGNAQELRFWTADGKPLPGVLAAPGRFGGFAGSSVGSLGSLFVVCGTDGLLRLWDPLAGKEVKSVRAFPENSGTAVASPDGTVVAAVERSGTQAALRFWRSESLEPLGRFEAAAAAFGQIQAFSGDSRRFVYGVVENGAIRLRSCEIATGRESAAPATVPMLSFPQVQVSPDGRFAVVLTHARGADLRTTNAEVRLWDIGSGRMTPLALPGSVRGTMQAVFSTDGRALAVISSDGTVGVWPLAGAPSAVGPG